ncbi:hypothetical protein EVAR_73042_1 [Eumeta japonica]|uniref:Uncharacterized protein n=1 Tax=Eumeta variegata TaxID=151549 RepID=A0A4C1SJM8_EUMVA|nr:hypothetical protein EVAR_73042_1 [Eumeta japonica]
MSGSATNNKNNNSATKRSRLEPPAHLGLVGLDVGGSEKRSMENPIYARSDRHSNPMQDCAWIHVVCVDCLEKINIETVMLESGVA